MVRKEGKEGENKGAFAAQRQYCATLICLSWLVRAVKMK